MKQTIHKYYLGYYPGIAVETVLEIPTKHKVLTAGMQGQNLVVWVQVNPESPQINARFCVIGTGCELPCENLSYISTVQTPNGLVWHAFKHN